MSQASPTMQGIVGQHYLQSFIKDGSDNKGSIEALFPSSTQTALIMTDTEVLPGHFPPLGTFLRKKEYSTTI